MKQSFTFASTSKAEDFQSLDEVFDLFMNSHRKDEEDMFWFRCCWYGPYKKKCGQETL